MEAASGAGAARREGARRTLAPAFCLVTGLVLIAAGVLGFFFGGADFTSGPGVSGETFIVFEVNGWHNVVHVATGAFLVLMAASASTAITGALVFGVVYVAVTVLGFIDGDDLLTLAPINTADNFLHLALAIAGIVVGVAAGGLVGSARRRPAAT
ncbi:MAG: DUF4383 domain-containing protein [Thermoleophilaceae bacterium]|nr:DUF4383 domain-containing protein [Thermoleophilaceae bacterium]